MQYNGLNFRRNRNIITVPSEHPMPGFDGEAHIYLQFGRVAKEGDPGAVKTTWFIREDDDSKTPIWAVPIDLNGGGHGLTNLVYVHDSRGVIAITMFDGQVYQARVSHKGA